MTNKTLSAMLKGVAFLGLMLMTNISFGQSTDRTPNPSRPDVPSATDHGVMVQHATAPDQAQSVTFTDGTSTTVNDAAAKAFASRPAVIVDVNNPEINPEAMQAWVGEFNAWFDANRDNAQKAMSPTEVSMLNEPAALYRYLHHQALLDAKRAADVNSNK
jgi:hypothetical protein